MKTKISLAVVTLATLILYLPLRVFTGMFTVTGLDYVVLHRLRLEYAQEWIFGSLILPAWYTREFLGTPFWSNIHSFSWMPNHLALLAFDPLIAYSVGVAFAALAGAGAMFLYCRSLGLSHLASSVSAWTYIASGFFASRVLAGHLLVLEAYFALPLLFWLIELKKLRADRAVEIGFVCAIFMFCVAGHPQIPAYAIGATMCYAFARLHRAVFRRTLVLTLQGIGLSAVIWVPMLLLAGRSARLLPLADTHTNIAFPYERLSAFVFPWKDGWPSFVTRMPNHPYNGPTAEFWDTVCYVGWLPLVAFVVTFYLAGKQRLAKGPWFFLAAMGAVSLLLALPLRDFLFSWFQPMLLRSPARLLYLLNFVLVVFLGVFLDRLQSSKWQWKNGPLILVAVLSAFHLNDLYQHSKHFVAVMPAQPISMPRIDELLKSTGGHDRIAIDSYQFINANRKYDDLGFFDALQLALPYQALIPTDGTGRHLNIEEFSGSRLQPPELSRIGIRYVISDRPKPELSEVLSEKEMHVYGVPKPAPRVGFWRELSRSSQALEDLTSKLQRPTPDQMTLNFVAKEKGFVEFIETWDIGWQASVNGIKTPIVKSIGFLMAVPVNIGENTIQLSYKTPGRGVGLLLTLLSGISAFFYIRRRPNS